MRVHQVLVGASPGDAVTQIAYAIDELIAPFAESSLWALHLDHRCRPRVGSIHDFPSADSAGPQDVIICHVSIGEPRVTDMVLRRPERLVVHYHNITPARYYEEVDPAFARLLSSGREELVALVRRSEAVLVDSGFNAEELRPFCPVPIHVTPPPVDHASLTKVDAHPPMVRHFAEVVDAPVVLHVGQLLPHKRPDVLISAFHVLTVDLRVPAHLVLVGPQRSADYTWAVQSYVQDLGLTNVWVAGERSEEELAACFHAASVFATASEHEGFCLPVVEAYAFGLPVVARDAGALPETVGSGGVLVPGDAGATMFAEALRLVLEEERVRGRLIDGAAEQLDRFSLDRSRSVMVDALRTVLGT